MLPSTAKVMFIDSVVVGKADFLARIPLSHELGTLSVQQQPASHERLGAYTNDFGDRKLYAMGDSVGSSLYTQTLLGGDWSKPANLSDISEEDYSFQNYPFLCSDGVTLFFSAKGPNSLGGRDIFMTIYDTDKAEWYQPQNYGLPFNSTANDYLLAIDDLDSLGWLVTDRFQPQDSVCIYTFVPTATRQDFTNDNLSDAQLQHYAKLQSIKDTWKFGNHEAAIKRKANLIYQKNNMKENDNMHFVINDQRVITSPTAFNNDESRALFRQLTEVKSLLEQSKAKLSALRQAYHSGNSSTQSRLAGDILRLEKNVQQQRQDILSLEKQIRQKEAQH